MAAVAHAVPARPRVRVGRRFARLRAGRRLGHAPVPSPSSLQTPATPLPHAGEDPCFPILPLPCRPDVASFPSSIPCAGDAPARARGGTALTDAGEQAAGPQTACTPPSWSPRRGEVVATQQLELPFLGPEVLQRTQQLSSDSGNKLNRSNNRGGRGRVTSSSSSSRGGAGEKADATSEVHRVGVTHHQ